MAKIKTINIDIENKIINSASHTVLGSLLICRGTASVSNTGTTITFPRAFNGTPVINLTLQDPTNWGAWITTAGASSFIAKQGYTGAPLTVHWIAIGVNS